MIDVPLALAFSTGLVVTVNPCGFAMLPAYLGFFVGSDAGADPGEADLARALGRALVVGLAVTVGFTATFAAVGFVVNVATSSAFEVAPWIGVAIGLAVAAYGIALLAGWDKVVSLPHLDRGGKRRTVGSMALFGVSYAVASVGCSLPIFASYTSLMFGRGLASGVAFFLAYAAGFGLLITALTVAIAMARQPLVTKVRSVLPLINRISGALLVATGAYVVHYAVTEIRRGSSATFTDDGVINRVSGWSADVSNWIMDTGATRIGAALAAVVAAAVLFVAIRRRTAGR